MKIAITGATGFVGVHLIHHLLKDGHEVVAIKRQSSNLDGFYLIKEYYAFDERVYDLLHWVDCELYDTYSLKGAFKDVDQVIHVAGFISYSNQDKAKLKQINHDYTSSIVDAALLATCDHFIYVSSTGAIAKPSDHDIDESAEWDNKLDHTYYGKTKYLGELEVHRGAQEGLEVSILNPGVILGYGDWNKGSLKLFKNAYKSFPFYSKGTTGFIGVKDLCKIIVGLVNKQVERNDQFIVITENRSFESIAKTMAKSFDVKPPFIEIKGILYKLTYSILWLKDRLGLSGILTAESAKASISQHSFNNAKLKSALPFDLTPIDDVIYEACMAYNEKRPTIK